MSLPLDSTVCLALFAVLCALLGLSALVLRRGRGITPARPGDALVMVAALVVVAALRPPFGGTGWGLLLGGLLLVASGWLGGAALPAAGACAALVVARSGAQAWAVATGAALGAWAAALGGLLPTWARGEAERRELATVVATATAVTAGAVGAALGLARHAAAPLELLAPALLVAVGMARLAAPACGPAAVAATGLVLASGLGAAGVALVAAPWRLLGAFVVGLVAQRLLATLAPDPREDWPGALRDGLLAALVLTVTAAVACTLGRGLGLAAALCAAALGDDEEPGPPVLCGQATLAALLLVRLGAERFGPVHGRLDLYVPTIVTGLLVGCLAPLAAGQLAARFAAWPDERTAGRQARWELNLTVLAVLAVGPLVVGLAWGPAASAAVMAAAAVAPLLLLALSPLTELLGERPVRWFLALPLLFPTSAAMAAAVMASAWRLSQLSRTHKTAIVAAVVLSVLLHAWVQHRRDPGDLE